MKRLALHAMTRAPDTPGRVHRAAHHARGIDRDGGGNVDSGINGTGNNGTVHGSSADSGSTGGNDNADDSANRATNIAGGGFMRVRNKTKMAQLALQGVY